METYTLKIWGTDKDFHFWPGLLEEDVALIRQHISRGMPYIEYHKGKSGECELIMTSQIVKIRVEKRSK